MIIIFFCYFFCYCNTISVVTVNVFMNDKLNISEELNNSDNL